MGPRPLPEIGSLFRQIRLRRRAQLHEFLRGSYLGDELGVNAHGVDDVSNPRPLADHPRADNPLLTLAAP